VLARHHLLYARDRKARQTVIVRKFSESDPDEYQAGELVKLVRRGES